MARRELGTPQQSGTGTPPVWGHPLHTHLHTHLHTPLHTPLHTQLCTHLHTQVGASNGTGVPAPRCFPIAHSGGCQHPIAHPGGTSDDTGVLAPSCAPCRPPRGASTPLHTPLHTQGVPAPHCTPNCTPICTPRCTPICTLRGCQRPLHTRLHTQGCSPTSTLQHPAQPQPPPALTAAVGRCTRGVGAGGGQLPRAPPAVGQMLAPPQQLDPGTRLPPRRWGTMARGGVAP